jgi:hypothetical protein
MCEQNKIHTALLQSLASSNGSQTADYSSRQRSQQRYSPSIEDHRNIKCEGETDFGIASYLRNSEFNSRSRGRLFWLKVFIAFPQSLQANSGALLPITPRLLPSKSFPINYSSLIYHSTQRCKPEEK